MPLNPTNTYTLDELMPMGKYYETIACVMAPNQTLARGQAVAYNTAASGKEVQTLTVNHTGGTRRYGITTQTGVIYTGNLAWNASNAVTQAALVAILGAGTVVVTGTPGTNVIVTWQNNGLQPLLVIDQALTTGGTADTLAETTAGNLQYGLVAYVSSGANGTGTMIGVVASGFISDPLGVMTQVAGDLAVQSSVPVFTIGRFNAADLVNVDAAALSGRGMIETQPIATGVVRLF